MYGTRGYPSRPSSQGLRYYRKVSRRPPTLGGLPLDAEKREALELRNKKPHGRPGLVAEHCISLVELNDGMVIISTTTIVVTNHMDSRR